MMQPTSIPKPNAAYRRGGLVPVALLAVSLLVHVVSVAAQSEAHPLAPPDLSSPRATLTNFLALMNDACFHWKAEGRTYENRVQRAAIARLAHQFFDLNDVAPAVRKNVGRETAVFMKEVLDRVGLPPVEQIPDESVVVARGLNRWTIPHTEIRLIRLKDGLHEGDWVFDSATDERAPEFYARARHLPYQAGASEGLYDLFVSEPGWMIPGGLIRALPDSLRSRFGGQAVWQWIALTLILVVTAGLMVLAYRVTARWSRRRRGASYYLAVVFPLLAVIIPQLATDFLSDQVFVTGRLFVVLDFVLDLVSLGALVALILAVTNRLANALVHLPWFRPRQLNAQLAQLIVRALGVGAALVTVFEGGRYVGVPLTTLVAGVSVSGLTVALAAQDTLKNLFGSLMILLDGPFQVGDSVRVKGHEGTVESVGLRSTRIRDASGHVVSISNDEIARLDSKNISRRGYLRRQEVLRLRGDTPADRIQRFAARLREMLENHEGHDPSRPPTVRIGLGEDAVIVTITYFYHPPDAAAFGVFNDRITLRILEEMTREGISLYESGHRPAAGERGAPYS